MGEVRVGPTVTQYSLKPDKGMKLSRITSLSNDLALALAAHPIRIEAPIPGKALVGIEVPNQKTALVSFKELLETKEFKRRNHNLMMALGKDVAGKTWFADLPKMPHLLIAGATGSGKTVCVNTILMSLLYQNTAETLRMIMVDPKRVELTLYNGIPHLLTPVITNTQKTVNALKWCIGEMDRRFELLASVGSRDISSYNAKHPDTKIPHIVFVIDELADLMATAASEVEAGIIRLAQMARAVGIHLIVATQRPSVDVITGLMKANIPGRIAFSVASLIDSRTILDSPGAEKLLGRGDMLYQTAELSKPVRIQGAFISEEELKSVVDYLKGDEEPEYDESIVETQKSGTANMFGGASDDQDPLFDEAKDVILKAGKASASFLQRRLKVGYARAARILDELEEAGIIGPSQGAKPREILVTENEVSNPMNAGGKLNAFDDVADDEEDEEEYEEEDELEEDEEYEEDEDEDTEEEEEEEDLHKN
ncbi:cell division protein FtsK [Candidatus Parcubacteria bacterium]|nr:MAG: cell division protein FtsK [Candidatus Parcubacteria bacterium]